jgi:hypothetical protein
MTSPLTDAVGNPLHDKDLVVIRIGTEVLVAHVVKVSQGGIAIADGGGNPQETPPFVVFAIDPYTIICHPHPITKRVDTRLGTVYRVVDPNLQAAIEKLASEAS